MLQVFNYAPPPALHDSIERSKHKLCFNVCLSITLSMLVVICMNYAFQFRQIFVIQWVVMSVFVALTWLFRSGAISRVVAVTTLLATGLIFLIVVVAITGTIRSPILPWFCLNPLYAFWLLNRRHAMFWFVCSLVVFLGFFYLSLTGYSPPNTYDYFAGYNKIYAVFSQVLLMINIYIIGRDFETKKNSAIGEINQSNRELNITLGQLREAKEDLERAQKHKDIFIAQMSHEMRTPMNAICGVADLLTSKGVEKNLLAILSSSSRQLLNIIDDILDISKLQTGKFQVHSMTYLLDELLQDVYAYTRKACDDKGLSLQFSVNDVENVHLDGDPYRMRQILNNILSNAVKFTEKGVIRFAVDFRPAQSLLVFTITDTGIGMTEEELGRIFTPFSQANDHIHIKYGGTGIGMNIAKQLTELFGGSITVASRYGYGSEVRVMFPVTVASQVEERTVVENPEIARIKVEALSSKKILLAEDNEVNRIIFTELIRTEIPDISINTAADGEEVLLRLQNGNFDLVVMDIQMPRMDGIEATRRIREHPSNKIRSVCIIALSAYARKSEIEECIASGMNGYLTKPIDKRELIDKAYELLVAPPAKSSPERQPQTGVA